MSNIQDGGFCESSERFLVFNYFRKKLHLNVWQDSFLSVVGNNFRKKLHLRCVTGFEFASVDNNHFRKKFSILAKIFESLTPLNPH